MDKRALVNLVVKKLKGRIKSNHVRSVINLFLDEMKRDLYKGNQIKIGNFCTFKIKHLQSKPVLIAKTQTFKQARESFALRISLTKRFAKAIIKS